MVSKPDPKRTARQAARCHMLSAARLYAFVMRMDGIRRALSDGAYQKQQDLEGQSYPAAAVELFDDPIDFDDFEPLGLATYDAEAILLGAAEAWARITTEASD